MKSSDMYISEHVHDFRKLGEEQTELINSLELLMDLPEVVKKIIGFTLIIHQVML